MIKSSRKITSIGILTALSVVLMILGDYIPTLPIVPSNLTFDFSDFPALIASFSFGPLAGIAVCAFKNIIHLPFSSTLCIGELSNFLIGCFFVIPSGLIYKIQKNRKNALIGSIIGALNMAFLGFFSNLLIIYPLFAKFVVPYEGILGMYTTILPSVNSLAEGILIFNVPFTFFKGLINVIITFLIYKKISPILKGTFR